MADFPNSARVVIIGQGGIVGASVAHHLAERGWDNIVGIDSSSIPTDVGSTAHASDFCYATSHDHMSCYTTMYSIDFYEKMGHYARVGGLEVARVGDEERMLELQRKVASGKAPGTNAVMISAAEAKEKFPLLEEDVIQGALWDRRRPGEASFAGGSRQAGGRSRGDGPVPGVCQHRSHRTRHPGRAYLRRRDQSRLYRDNHGGRLCGPLGAHRGADGGRRPAHHAR